MDGDGKELLRWAITELAGKGDRVVAVHVCRDCDLCKTTAMTLIKVLDDYLAGFEGLYRTKKVFLVGRVARGNSIKKVILKEAALFTAMAVVVGVNKIGTFGVCAPLAKYCAKKLPPTSSLFAVHDGKVVFEKRASMVSTGGETRQTLRSVLQSDLDMEAEVVIPSFGSMPRIEASSLPKIEREDSSASIGHDRLHELDRVIESDSSSVSELVRTLPQRTLGWPVLRKAAASGNIKAMSRNMSVVEWAMNLPDRSSPAVQSRESSRRNTLRGKGGKFASVDLTKNVDGIVDSKASFCKWFQYEELQSSTNHFHSDNFIGKGGSSKVYKGCLSDGGNVAIKMSKFSTEASSNFISEINIITSLQHKHILPLLGICITEQTLISVYDHFSRGSLAENIHGERATPSLTWATRYKVAVRLCEALAYLHNDCSRPVIHRDVKSSNILLSEEFEPQLSDFGLAVWAPKAASYQTQCDVVGTFGYIAPEYFMYGRVSDKIDVFAFGVVLLELLTGRKPISNDNPNGHESLVMWAAPLLGRGEVSGLLDPNLDCEYEEDQVQRIVLAASLCIIRTASLRPAMSQILRLLQGEEDRDAWMEEYSNSQRVQECLDDEEEAYPASGFGSHLGLALMGVEGVLSPPPAVATATGGMKQSKPISWEEYLKERMSRSSSFN